MTARFMREVFGADLIGSVVLTEKIGAWPGGYAKVTEIDPDPAAPEIVFQVEHLEHGTMGIFEQEEVSFARRPHLAIVL